jgi:hypothetical protein
MAEKPRHLEGMKFEDGTYRPDHDPLPLVATLDGYAATDTVAVTPHPEEDIPAWLVRNSDNSFQWTSPATPSAAGPLKPPTTAAAPTPSASGQGGTVSGSEPASPPKPPATDEDPFARFATVSLTDTEQAMRKEADRRYYSWAPTKGSSKLSRPRKSTFLRQVRAEFKKAGLI